MERLFVKAGDPLSYANIDILQTRDIFSKEHLFKKVFFKRLRHI